MKKYYVVFPLLFLIAALGSTENVEVQKEAQDTPPDNKIAAFDGSLLIHKPKSFWLLQYQNPQGKTFSNKEVKAMLMEIPENSFKILQYMERVGIHAAWRLSRRTYGQYGLCNQRLFVSACTGS